MSKFGKLIIASVKLSEDFHCKNSESAQILYEMANGISIDGQSMPHIDLKEHFKNLKKPNRP